MRAVKWYGPFDLRVEEAPEPTIRLNEDALVRPTAAAICGTDLHVYTGALTVVPGGVLGHEFMGVVEKVGKDVKRFREGERVIVSAWIADGSCWFCRRQLHTQCENTNIFGMGPAYGESLDGAFADLVRVPYADTVMIKAPEGVPDEKLVMVSDALPTGHDAIINAGMEPGDIVAILGCGPIGLLSGMCAATYGASHVIAIDMVRERLEMARSLGFTTINASEVDPAEEVRNMTDGRGADIVVEAVGKTVEPLRTAIDMVRKKGTVSVVGFHLQEYNIPVGGLWLTEKRVIFSIGNPIRSGERLTRLIASGKIDPSRIISHRVDLEKVPMGFELFEKKKALKVLVKY
ncbi:Alcohol dehydrogenase [Candidatus Calditenuaceae archaeon HR02]|nr:Alcohol dehydrogenase [Candidatus Calditenuaceae archaeon HR02]